MADPWVTYKGAPLAGPFDIRAMLLDNVQAAPFEGIWIPIRYAKAFSVETFGSVSALSLQLYGSNADGEPGNVATVTVGGAVGTGDALHVTFVSPINGTTVATYTAVGGDTNATEAAGLAAAINASMVLQKLSVSASSAGAVVTISWPSVAGGAQSVDFAPAGFNTSITEPAFANFITLSTSVTGTETLTLANGTTGTTLGGAITAPGFALFNPYALRWLKARVTTLTGTISQNFYGVA